MKVYSAIIERDRAPACLWDSFLGSLRLIHRV